MSALDLVNDWPVPRSAVVVVGPDGVLASCGETSTAFQLASVTKPLTALATLIAVQEEALDLDAPVPPDLYDTGRFPDARITVRQLLSHASGIDPAGRTLLAAPETRRIYTNTGYDVLADAVAAATEIPFADYLSEGVFAPLGMTTARLVGPAGSGGEASVHDLVPVLSELLRPGRLLDPTTRESLAQPQFPDLDGVLPGFGLQHPNPWGLGFELRGSKSPHWTGSANSAATFGHFGRSGTMIWIDPVADLAVAALSDRDFGPWSAEAWPALSDEILAEFA